MFEQIEGCQHEVDEVLERNERYKEELYVEVLEALDALDKAKVILKWTLPVHR